ncbi:glycosyltransferase family A protein [Micromonospora tulbaghiae]|uniref:glycosyltransferase family A protein n=1 Tax=Micromonospora tulbaghiae TaxID=479978 RepID=UPI003664C135
MHEQVKPRITVVIPFYVAEPADAPGRYQGTLGPWSGAPAAGDAGRTRERHLHLMLSSLAAQTLPIDEFEVLVVDDGSASDVQRCVEDWRLNLRLRVIRQRHSGFCTAYNTGIEQARAPVVFLAVDHDILSPGTLAAHLARHAAEGTEAAVSGRQRYLFHSIIFNDLTDPSAGLADLSQLAMLPDLGWLPAAVRNLDLDRKPVTVDDVLHRFDTVAVLASCTQEYADVEAVLRADLANKLRCGWLAMRTGSNSVATSALRAVGGFDSQLDAHFGWYAEHDLGLRLFQSGVPFRFAEEAMAIDLFHGPPATAGIGKSTALAYLIGKHNTVDVALLPHYVDRVLDIEEYSHHAAAAQRWWPSNGEIR